MKLKKEKVKCNLCGAEHTIIWHEEGWGESQHECPKLKHADIANKFLNKQYGKN